MKREFLTTADGSLTIHLPDWDEQYHSKHGAIQEALHVFVQKGLVHALNHSDLETEKYAVLEIGFGTGLNAFLTYLYAEEHDVKLHYTGVEAYPVSISEVSKLNYPELCMTSDEVFLQMHQVPWETGVAVSEGFTLNKRKQFFSDIKDIENHHLIYFDAFGARVQPELWTESIFRIMYDALKPNGILVTYSAKGSVRRAMELVGFQVERLPGPPGKREMLRACKVVSDIQRS